MGRVIPSDGLPGQRRPFLPPVLIAVVCLAVIGGSVGYLWTAGFRLGGSSQRPVAAPAPSVPAVPAPSPTGSAALNAPSAPPPSSRPAPASPSGPQRCRDETQAAVHAGGGDVGDVYVKLKIRTEKGAVVYICANDSGEYYYHGSNMGENIQWRDGTVSLFIPGVKQQGTKYVATLQEADGSTTTITVSPTEWRRDSSTKPTLVESATAV